MDKNSIEKIVNDRVKAMEGNEFQAFCDRLLLKMFPDDYTPVRAGGKDGDMKNDGYCFISRKFFQAHASRGEKISKIEKKITDDLAGCVEKQRDVKEFIYITNDTQVGKAENHIDRLRLQYPSIKIETWGPTKIALLIMDFPTEDISYIIDLNLPAENQNNVNNYLMLVETEMTDLGIIGEICDFIFAKINTSSLPDITEPTNRKKFVELNTKITINFEGSQKKIVEKLFTTNWKRKTLVEQYIQPLMEIDEDRIYALAELIQSEYRTISGVKDVQAPIKDFTVFEKIGKTLLPKIKQKNPDYISNAKAIVLHFFEFCEIGALTTKEANKPTPRNLFEGLD